MAFFVVGLLVLVFSQKKFRKVPSAYLGIALFFLFIQISFFLLKSFNVFNNLNLFLELITATRVILPSLLFLFFQAHLLADYSWKKTNKKYFFPVLLFWGLILILEGCNVFFRFQSLGKFIYLVGMIYFGCSFAALAVRNIQSLYNAPDYNQQPHSKGIFRGTALFKYLRFMTFFLSIHSLILLSLFVYHLFVPACDWCWFDRLDQFYWAMIGLIFTYKFISFPVGIFQFNLEQETLPKTKYKDSLVQVDEARNVISKMNEYLLNQKSYKDPDYNLNSLAKDMGLPSKMLSQVMNTYMNQNFNDFINNFKVEEFKQLAKAPESAKFSILALALEAGFRSKSVFNSAFKKFTGLTPSEYCKNLKGQ